MCVQNGQSPRLMLLVLFIVCINNMIITFLFTDERCFNVKEFNSPVCTGAPIQEVNNKIYTKLDVFSDVAYSPGCERQSPLEFVSM